jgi:Holliday junction DNA helicase RuvA
MIAYIEGLLTFKSPHLLIIEPAGGLGYEVHISLSTYEYLKDAARCKVFTYFHVTQDAHVLYGFRDEEEKRWFLHLLGVNGVGPRMAMTILSYLTPEDLYRAIIDQHSPTLQLVKGIGPKVAQRIVLELQGKVSKQAVFSSRPQGEQALFYEQALAALVTLGVSKLTAEKKLVALLKTHPEHLTTEQLIKLALQA